MLPSLGFSATLRMKQDSSASLPKPPMKVCSWRGNISLTPSSWTLACRITRDCLFRSEEHTSELQSLMRISYAVFCLKKKKNNTHHLYQRSHEVYHAKKYRQQINR